MTISMTNEKAKDKIQKSVQIRKSPDFRHISQTITNDNMHTEPILCEC